MKVVAALVVIHGFTVFINVSAECGAPAIAPTAPYPLTAHARRDSTGAVTTRQFLFQIVQQQYICIRARTQLTWVSKGGIQASIRRWEYKINNYEAERISRKKSYQRLATGVNRNTNQHTVSDDHLRVKQKSLHCNIWI